MMNSEKQPRSVNLQTLLADAQLEIPVEKIEAIRVSQVVADSRLVKPGALFVACPGGTTDGHAYIPDAIQKGAVAVAGEKTVEGLSVPYIRLEGARRALAYLAAAFYGHPARRLTMIGVTGTDGKTTTCNLLYQILLAARIRVGMISTVNAIIGDQVLDTGFHVTTPDAPEVQHYLHMMVTAGLTHVILETTSHGWAQHRVDACEFDIGVVTNITHEHLDYHGSYEAYRAAKARLFTSLSETLPKPHGNPRLAVLNRDDGSYEYLSALLSGPQVSYGLSATAEVRAENILYRPGGISFNVIGDKYSAAVKTGLVGAFNVYNCLAALSASIVGLQISTGDAVAGIAALSGIPGRMERIDLGQPFTAVVDFAHTPFALQQAIETARTITSGRVIAIFGSAGLRDRAKRRMMAEISAEYADLTILTAEDPRTESIEAILEEMTAGAISKGGVEGKNLWRRMDRGEAIRFGIRLAQPGDIVLSCGKGHEQSMCFGKREFPWDDRTAMRAALAELLGIPGPEMPYLPTRDHDIESLKTL